MGSLAGGSQLSSTGMPLVAARTWASTSPVVWPGAMRKLMRAMAAWGSTLSFGLPSSIVGAMVVCSSAAEVGEAPNFDFSTPPNSQRLAMAMRVAKGVCGARASSICTPGPSSFSGNGCSAMAVTALARVTTAVSFGGMELWPPAARAVTRSVA